MTDRLVETHCSTLFFVDDLVYKRKKPLELGFLDFRSAGSRRLACEAEVALNRRMSPDVYLGVATLLGPGGTPCDSLVVMRRMPDERRLARCVAEGEDVRPALSRLAVQLASLHRRSPAPERLHHVGRVPFLGQLWGDGLTVLATHESLVPVETRERIRCLAEEYLAGRSVLLDHRVEEGHLVDGHGDLLADDVYLLDDAPRALDCLEFDDELRVGDGLADAAFLAMDLERLGRRDLARHFLGAYERAVGDHPPSSLVHYYTAYRAHVRCKVACLRHAQSGGPHEAEAARELAELALAHLEQGRVRAVVVGGPPGAGKSTVARGIAAALEARVLSTDVLRDALVPRRTEPSGLHEGRYAPAERERVYDELLAQSEELLLNGESLVLDGTFGRAGQRAAVRELAARAHVPLVELRCEAPDDVVVRRIKRRVGDRSEATAEVSAALRRGADAWPQAQVLQTTDDSDVVVQRALRLVGPLSG
jgi:uncharacterized protein